MFIDSEIVNFEGNLLVLGERLLSERNENIFFLDGHRRVVIGEVSENIRVAIEKEGKFIVVSD